MRACSSLLIVEWNFSVPFLKKGGDKMVKSKVVLMIVGILVLLMGILGLADVSASFAEPSWHAILKILLGLVALVVGYMDKT